MSDILLPQATPPQSPPQQATSPIPEEPRASLFSSVLVVAGFITLIVIVIWGLLNISTLASPWFSTLFNKNASPIKVTAPALATSTENFSISWKHSTKEDGMYALLYPCKNNFHLETSGVDGAANPIPCGAAITVSPTNNAIIVKPILYGTATSSVSFSIIFMPSATTSKQVEGSASVVIHPLFVIAKPQTPVAPINPAPSVPVLAAPRVASPADLSVRVLSINVDPSGMATVQFDIANVGGSTSGTYFFEAYLPTQSGYTYASPAQSPLGPGDHVVNTLNFSQAVSGTVSIVVDSSDSVRESNENNNYTSQSLATPYYGQQYPYGY